MQRIEAFLIDSNKLFREGLKRLLDDSPFQIVAEAGNIREGVAIAESGLRPQLVLLDLVNGGDDEAEAMRRLRALLPDTRMVVLTTDLCTRRLANALEAGADGYLMKDLSADALAQSLRLVMMGAAGTFRRTLTVPLPPLLLLEATRSRSPSPSRSPQLVE